MKRLEEIKNNLLIGKVTEGEENAHHALSRSDINFLVAQTTVVAQIYENLYNLGWSMQDAPFFGMNKDARNGVDFAIEKVLKGTGVLMGSIIQQRSIEDQNERIKRAVDEEGVQ